MSDTNIVMERRRFLMNVERHLRLLDTDLRLQREGVTYSYVIDFSALYAYLYKTFDATALPVLGSDSEARNFARQQVALRFLFSDATRPVLLIPPYAAELRNHLDVVRLQLKLADEGVREVYRDKLTRMVQRSEEFQRFLETRRDATDESSSNIAALNVGKEYFPELYTVLVCTVTEGLSALKTLFSGKILQDSEAVLPVMRDFSFERMEERAMKWYKQISRIRRSKRAYQTLTDALACTYIEVANERVNQRGHVVVFVSPSSHVRAVMAGRKLVHPRGGDPIEAERDLEYFLLHFTHRGELGRVAETLGTTGELLRLYGELRGQDSDIAEDSKRLLIESEPLWRRAENHFLLSDSELVKSGGAIGDGSVRIDRSFLALLTRLHNAAEEAGGSLQAEGERLLGGLKDAVIELDRMVPVEKTAAALSKLEITAVRDAFRVTFPPLPDEFPLTIQVSDRSLRVVSDRICKLSNKVSDEDALWIRKEIMNLASGPDAGPEHSLFAAYVLAMEAKFEAALAELERGAALGNGGSRKELFYLGAVINRRLLNSPKAASWIEKALAADAGDARFRLEHARVLWLSGQFGTATGAYDPDLNALEAAIAEAEEARVLAGGAKLGRAFVAQVHNCLAYFNAERALIRRNCSDVGAADAHLARVRELVDEKDWIGKFNDTVAWVEYARARCMVTGPAQRESLIRAMEHVRRALSKENAAQGRKRLLALHEGRIQEALVDLGEASPA